MLTGLSLTDTHFLLDESNTFGGTHDNSPQQFSAGVRYGFTIGPDCQLGLPLALACNPSENAGHLTYARLMAATRVRRPDAHRAAALAAVLGACRCVRPFEGTATVNLDP